MDPSLAQTLHHVARKATSRVSHIPISIPDSAQTQLAPCSRRQVMRFKFLEDQKRALVSRLLVRRLDAEGQAGGDRHGLRGGVSDFGKGGREEVSPSTE